MRAIDPGVLVLPSHGLPFRGLHTRIDQLQRAPRRALRRGARGLRRGAAERVRPRAGAVQAHARPAPDDLRDGRVDRPPARALAAPASCERSTGADGVIRFADRLRPAGARAGLERRRFAAAQPRARRVVVGHHRSHDVPEARAVVHLAQVRELVRDDVVDRRQREVDQAPVQADRAVGVGAAPARLRRRQRRGASTRTPRRAAKWAQRSSKTRRAWRCSQLCTASRICARRRAARQRRRAARAAAHGVAAGATGAGCAPRGVRRAGSSTTRHRLAEVADRRAVAPDDAARPQPRGSARAARRAGEDPGAPSRAARPRSSRSAHPVRRAAPSSPFGADDEADAAPAHAPKAKGDTLPVEAATSRVACGWRRSVVGERATAASGDAAGAGVVGVGRAVVEQAALQRIDDRRRPRRRPASPARRAPAPASPIRLGVEAAHLGLDPASRPRASARRRCARPDRSARRSRCR